MVQQDLSSGFTVPGRGGITILNAIKDFLVGLGKIDVGGVLEWCGGMLSHTCSEAASGAAKMQEISY